MKKEEITVTANRKYKDTIFRMIFRDKKELLSLYNAVNNSHYEKEEDLQIVTLENAPAGLILCRERISKTDR